MGAWTLRANGAGLGLGWRQTELSGLGPLNLKNTSYKRNAEETLLIKVPELNCPNSQRIPRKIDK